VSQIFLPDIIKIWYFLFKARSIMLGMFYSGFLLF